MGAMDLSKKIEAQYQRQQEYTSSYEDFEVLAREAEEYEKSLDRYRHLRMLTVCDPLLHAYTGSRWLTVGDGRFATDARYLAKRGANAIATDIDDTALKIAQQAGLIAEIRKENAEQLSFADDSFDFVLCKEAYHHFPRPMIAVYEFLRVARVGVVLIEPNDRLTPDSPKQAVFAGIGNLIAKVLKSRAKPHQYEEAGNYVYTLSRTELEKLACGIGLAEIWVGHMDDHYIVGLGSVPHDPQSVEARKLERTIRMKMLLSQMGAKPWGLIRAVLAKEPLSETSAAELRALGFRKFVPPPNPYLL